MSKKLQNVKAIQQMLDGTHKFQTKKIVGFSDAEDAAKKNERHDVGDIWEEKDPVSGVIYIVEQREGFRIKKTNNADVLQGVRDDLRAFPNCRKETCTCAGTHHLDKKMKVIHGLCFDCTIEMEHELKKAGTFNEYAYNKMRENALAWLQSAERDVEMLKEIYTQASKFVTNSDGITETWSAKMSPEEFEETIQSDFNKYKEEFIEKINKEYPHEKID
jgi:hypothetical protein